MNDQIKELALKSGIAYLSEHTAYFQANDGLTVLPSVSSLKEFAELIVRECLKQVYGRTKMAPGDYNWPEKDVGYNEGINAAYKQIKKHFGVEE